MIKLKRKKIGDRSYQLVDAKTGEVIALAAQTGEHGRDNYPWEWHMADDKIFAKLSASTGQSADALKTCVDYVESFANAHGILRYVGPVDPYTVTTGQVFRYHGQFYRATANARGEFNAYIECKNYKEQSTEIYVPHGATVTLYV